MGIICFMLPKSDDVFTASFSEKREERRRNAGCAGRAFFPVFAVIFKKWGSLQIFFVFGGT